MPITLRRAHAFAKLNGPDAEDFDVVDGDRRIGRVYRTSQEDQAQWCWSISTAVASKGISGRSPTRILAVRTLADTYDAVKDLHPIRNSDRLPFRPLRVSLLAVGR
jgi:hypothetical protein